jgi:large subunit ribosomal protein L15
MSLNKLRPEPGSRKNKRRRGRGPGSGRGKTSGRGHKGQLSGAGFTQKRGFEGGQMPLVRRIPKRGFTNIFRVDYQAVNVERLNALPGDEIGLEAMKKAGLIRGKKPLVKILGRGELQSARTIRAHAFSQTAVKKIEEAGGKAVVIGSENA